MSADTKRYYWIKLRDTFLTSDAVDFLMSQKNGSQYVVLYQMLCLKTINTNGELARTIGEVLIPYDAEKIQRDCKYFDIDNIRVALELYKKLGLVYEQENGILQIADFERMVGSEVSSAERVRKFRQRKKELEINGQNALLCNAKCNALVTQEKEIRDKEIRDKDNIAAKTISRVRAREELNEVFDFDNFLAIVDMCYKGVDNKAERLIDTFISIYEQHPDLRDYMLSDRRLLGMIYERFFEIDPVTKKRKLKDIANYNNYITSIIKSKASEEEKISNA